VSRREPPQPTGGEQISRRAGRETEMTLVRVCLRCPSCSHVWYAALIDTESWWGKGLKPERIAKQCCCVVCDSTETPEVFDAAPPEPPPPSERELQTLREDAKNPCFSVDQHNDIVRKLREADGLCPVCPTDVPPEPPPDPMGDTQKVSIVRELIEFWSTHPQRSDIPEETRRQMAQEAGAIARSAMGELEELRRMAAPSETPHDDDPHGLAPTPQTPRELEKYGRR